MTGSTGTTALLAVTTIGVVLMLVVGVARAARRAGLPPWFAPTAGAAMLVWLGAVADLSFTGILSQWSVRPSPWPLLPLTFFVALILLSFTRRFRQIAAEVPAWQPVVLQVFRAAVEIVFWRLCVAGAAPVQITFEGRNLDVVAGLTAPLIAFGLATGWIGRRVSIAWNLVGLALLINAVWTVATSVPGPLHRHWPGQPFTAITSWPTIWVPAFLVPIAVFLHLLSIRAAVGVRASAE